MHTSPDEPHEYVEAETGVRVIRLTGGSARNVPLYFTGSTFSRDAQKVFFWSDRSGDWQVYAVEIATGRVEQLTQLRAGAAYLACPSPAREEMVLVDGRKVLLLSLTTHETREVYEGPEGFVIGLPSVSADGRWCAFAYSEQLELTTRGGQWHWRLAEQYFRRPSSVVMVVDLDRAESEAVWGEREWISHVSLSPADPHLVMFCREGAWMVDNRIWMLDRRQRLQRRPWAPYPQARDEHVTHEFFAADGRVVFQIFRGSLDYRGGIDWDAQGYVGVMQPDGTGLVRRKHADPKPIHLAMDRAQTRVVGDCCPGRPDGQAWLGLAKWDSTPAPSPPGEPEATEELRFVPVCRHATSWKDQFSHPHPGFSPDGKWLAFCSDREGSAQVYVAEIGE